MEPMPVATTASLCHSREPAPSRILMLDTLSWGCGGALSWCRRKTATDTGDCATATPTERHNVHRCVAEHHRSGEVTVRRVSRVRNHRALHDPVPLADSRGLDRWRHRRGPSPAAALP